MIIKRFRSRYPPCAWASSAAQATSSGLRTKKAGKTAKKANSKIPDINQLPMQQSDWTARPLLRRTATPLCGDSRQVWQVMFLLDLTFSGNATPLKLLRGLSRRRTLRTRIRGALSVSAISLLKPRGFRPAFFYLTKVRLVSLYLKASARARKKALTRPPPPREVVHHPQPPATIALFSVNRKNTSDRCATSSASPGEFMGSRRPQPISASHDCSCALASAPRRSLACHVEVHPVRPEMCRTGDIMNGVHVSLRPAPACPVYDRHLGVD